MSSVFGELSQPLPSHSCVYPETTWLVTHRDEGRCSVDPLSVGTTHKVTGSRPPSGPPGPSTFLVFPKSAPGTSTSFHRSVRKASKSNTRDLTLLVSWDHTKSKGYSRAQESRGPTWMPPLLTRPFHHFPQPLIPYLPLEKFTLLFTP